MVDELEAELIMPSAGERSPQLGSLRVIAVLEKGTDG